MTKHASVQTVAARQPSIAWNPTLQMPHLCWRIIVWDVEPQTMTNGGWHALAQRKRVPAHEIGPLAVGIVQSVEEKGGGRGQQVVDVLLQGINVLRGEKGCRAGQGLGEPMQGISSR